MSYRRRLYTVVLRAEAQEQTGKSLARQLDLQGLLDTGSTTTAISSDPDQISVDATLAGTQAGKLATELEELATASGFDAVPFFVKGSETSEKDGYYVLESVDGSPGAAWAADRARELRISMRREGTHETHWSAVDTTQAQLEHPFGNDTQAVIAIPDAATKRRWYDPETTTATPVGAPIETRPAEFDAVDVYDLADGETALSTDDPALIYELPYSDAGVVDPVLWDSGPEDGYGDDYGTDYGGVASKFDADGIRQWAHVFTASHEFVGVPILDSGLLRVYARESAGDLVAETWSEANNEWQAVGLDWTQTDYELFDWDVEAVSPTAIRAQATFIDASAGASYALDASLQRGWETLQFAIPANESDPVPSGLEATLDPIASTRIVDAQPDRSVIPRREVRR